MKMKELGFSQNLFYLKHFYRTQTASQKDRTNNFNFIPDNNKPVLAENKKRNIFPANDLGESSCQISESSA